LPNGTRSLVLIVEDPDDVVNRNAVALLRGKRVVVVDRHYQLKRVAKGGTRFGL
jgi:hypothetical protein